jgi:methyltransferase (TIGR00027 family)
MIEGRPSRTAMRVAMLRAAHQFLDTPKIFDDPLALRIIGAEAAATLRAEQSEESDAASRAMRAFLCARSRFAEDELARAVKRGVRQYVVLGAGLDTFAYRNPHPGVRVFEVDFPATQMWKQKKLRAAEIAVPETLTFAPVDFEKQTLAEGLLQAGFRAGEPAFFAWLGVTPYLNRETVLSTFRTMISLSPQNGVAFDYAVPRASLDAASQIAFDLLAGRVAAAGEPFVGFFSPEELAQGLRALGYHHIQDFGREEIEARYFTDRQDGLRIGRKLARLMCARG